MTGPRAGAISGCVALALLLAGPAGGWEAATTHAGLTQQAVMSSSLKQRLGEMLGLSFGLWETLRIAPAPPGAPDALRERLARLDAAGGYAPAEGRMTVLGWLMAGSVLESVPVERERNHFFDPTRKCGLSEGGLITGFGRGLLAVSSGISSVRELFAGTSFDGSGMASTAWIASVENDLGLPRYLALRVRAVAAPTAEEREGAAAEALLAAGAILHVVEDAGDPAYVHNDFRADLFGQGAPFDRFVAARWGRLAVPRPAGAATQVAHLDQLISNPDHTGLADRTAQRFYSTGLLDAEAEPARQRHGLSPLVAGKQASGYLLDGAKKRVARWRYDEDGALHWDLDERCYADAASVLLPETVQAALSALEHLFRGGLRFDAEGLRNGPLALGAGKVSLFLEESDGKRRILAARDVTSAAANDLLLVISESDRDHRLAAVFSGVDGNGEPLVVSIFRKP